MSNLTTIDNKQFEVKEFQGQRVVTFKDIDMLHERVEGTAKRNFNENRYEADGVTERFIKGVDYFHLTFEEARSTNFVHRPNSQGLTIITESGYLMLVKSLNDDLAWKVQRELVNNYFRVKQSRQLSAIDQLRLQYQVIEQHEEKLNKVSDKVEYLESKTEYLENNMTIEHGQEVSIKKEVDKRVKQVCYGSESPAYLDKTLRSKIYRALWRDYKDYFNITSYHDTLKKDFETALKLIGNWKPSGGLLRELELSNNQQSFSEVACTK